MTITVNLHSGLATWSSGAFALGQRCATGGNAYQCTTAGAATAAPTGVGGVIPVAGGAVFKWLSAIDYTSIVTMTTAFSTTLTDNVNMNIWNDGIIITSDLVVGATTPGSFVTTMQPAPGEGWKDNVGNGAIGLGSSTRGVMIESQTGYTSTIKASSVGVALLGLQISGNNNNYQTLYNNSGNLILDGCIIQATSICAKFYVDSSGGRIINNVFIAINNILTVQVELDSLAVGQIFFMNNLVIRPTNFVAGGIGVDGSASVISDFSDNAIFGFTVAPTGNTWAGSNNASDVAACIPPGTTGNLSSAPFTVATFTQPSAATTLNIRLPISSVLVNAGINNGLVSIDMLGTSRPQGLTSDIGPFELSAAYIPHTPIVVFFG